MRDRLAGYLMGAIVTIIVFAGLYLQALEIIRWWQE